MSVYTPSVNKNNQKIIDLENAIIQEINNLYICLQNPSYPVCSTTTTNITKLNELINSTPSAFLNNTTYDNDYHHVLSQSNQIQKLRGELDFKMKELYQLNGSSGNIYKTYVDSTIYTNILWGVLATSIVYFLFLKL